MKLYAVAPGLCRVYYKEGRKLLTFQEDFNGVFNCYTCDHKGEPESLRVLEPQDTLDKIPKGRSQIEKNFRKWQKESAINCTETQHEDQRKD